MDQTLTESVKALLIKINPELQNSPWPDARKNIGELIRQMEEPCVVAVAGLVKAGKSSFLNAFLKGDYAPVGETATTATINYFKYGLPPDPNKPVLCTWRNATTTWETREFLEKLQGHGDESLAQANAIDCLTFFLPEPRLNGITLVDTPGAASMVDQHQDATEDFLFAKNLRDLQNWQENASARLVGHADAVIFVVNSTNVITESDKSILENLDKSLPNTFSIMLVVAQIDKNAETFKNRAARAESWNSQIKEQISHDKVGAAVPCSSGLQRFCDSNPDKNVWLKFRQELIALDPDDQDLLLAKPEKFISSKYISLSVDERQQLISHLPWATFLFMANHLARLPEFSWDNFLRDIKEGAGFDLIHQKLYELFLQRSAILRCYRIISNTYVIVQDLLNRWPSTCKRLQDGVEKKKRILDFINGLSGDPEILAELGKMVEESIPACCDWNNKLDALFLEIDEKRIELSAFDQNFSMLQKVTAASDEEFPPEERTELERIFGKLGLDIQNRLPAQNSHEQLLKHIDDWESYWRGISWKSPKNSLRAAVAQKAEECYAELRYQLTREG